MNDFNDLIDKGQKNNIGKPINHVAFILDTSGSMGRISESSMNNFNEQIQALKEESYDQDTYVTLVMFNSNIDFVYVDKKLEEVEELTEYRTGSMTALYDAIGETIVKLKKKPIENENTSFLVIVITDGEENASIEFKGNKGRIEVKKMITDLEKKGNWTFTFLGANIDVEDVAEHGLAFTSANTVCFDSCNDGIVYAGAEISKGIKTYYNDRRYGKTQTRSFFVDRKGDKNDS